MEEKNFKVALFSVFKRAIEEKRRSDFSDVVPLGDWDSDDIGHDKMSNSFWEGLVPAKPEAITENVDLKKILNIFAMSVPSKVNRLCQFKISSGNIFGNSVVSGAGKGSKANKATSCLPYIESLNDVLNGAIANSLKKSTGDVEQRVDMARGRKKKTETEESKVLQGMGSSMFSSYIKNIEAGNINTLSPYISKLLPIRNSGDKIITKENAKTPTLSDFVDFTTLCENRRMDVLQTIWKTFGISDSDLRAGFEGVAKALIRYIDGNGSDELFSEFESDVDISSPTSVEKLREYASDNGIDVSRLAGGVKDDPAVNMKRALFITEKIMKTELEHLMRCDYIKEPLRGTYHAKDEVSMVVANLYKLFGNAPVEVLNGLSNVLNSKEVLGVKLTGEQAWGIKNWMWVPHINDNTRLGVIFKSINEEDVKGVIEGDGKADLSSNVGNPVRGYSVSMNIPVNWLSVEDNTGVIAPRWDKTDVNEYRDEDDDYDFEDGGEFDEIEETDAIRDDDDEEETENEFVEALFSEIIGNNDDSTSPSNSLSTQKMSILIDGWVPGRTENSRTVNAPEYFIGDGDVSNNKFGYLHGVIPLYYRCLDPIIVLAFILEKSLDKKCSYYKNNESIFMDLYDKFGCVIA